MLELCQDRLHHLRDGTSTVAFNTEAAVVRFAPD